VGPERHSETISCTHKVMHFPKLILFFSHVLRSENTSPYGTALRVICTVRIKARMPAQMCYYLWRCARHDDRFSLLCTRV